MAEWGWRTPRQVQDPVLRSIIQSLERYLIVDDQGKTELVGTVDERLDAVIAHVTALLPFIAWYVQNVGSSNELFPYDGDYLDGIDLALPFSFYGIDSDGNPYINADGVTVPEDRAWIGLDTDGNPYFVRVGGPASEPPPFPPPLPS